MLHCPRDRSELEPTQFLAVEMDACPYCDGTWLDAGELASIHGWNMDADDRAGLATTDPRGPIACPHCAIEMETRWFSTLRKIIIDQCPNCRGTWLDGAELRMILAELGQQKERR